MLVNFLHGTCILSCVSESPRIRCEEINAADERSPVEKNLSCRALFVRFDQPRKSFDQSQSFLCFEYFRKQSSHFFPPSNCIMRLIDLEYSWKRIYLHGYISIFRIVDVFLFFQIFSGDVLRNSVFSFFYFVVLFKYIFKSLQFIVVSRLFSLYTKKKMKIEVPKNPSNSSEAAYWVQSVIRDPISMGYAWETYPISWDSRSLFY